MNRTEDSSRSRLAAALLCFFLGWLGVHRFYVGKVGTAILMALTLGGFGIWTTIDLILIVVGVFTDDEGRPVSQWMAPAAPEAAGPTEVERRMDRIDRQLTDLQGVLIDMTEKLDRQRYGSFV